MQRLLYNLSQSHPATSLEVVSQQFLEKYTVFNNFVTKTDGKQLNSLNIILATGNQAYNKQLNKNLPEMFFFRPYLKMLA